ncbi:right-handed parallel beta-helix repeat-containing protein [Ochrovirga pacifica]|uniref:right-handed parallel beta-helix repeat-containing protein n=1 Tax=Ochrovirga pacifica TaxID=1042376 RepID=UPI000255A260|nr:right-handed parallel beta-helix repeat-containing protein [Ochrovirga pacifica]
MKKVPFFLFFVGITLATLAKDYHVDGRNKQRGNGTLSNPFQTIQQAVEVMRAGDVCYIHQGVYREQIVPSRSGTKKRPIIFTRYKNDEVIITATQRVKGWELYQDKIYKANNIQMDLGVANNVYCNNEKMQLARWPNNIDNNEYSLDAKFIDKTKGTWSMSFISNNEIPKIDWTGGVIHYLGAHSGCAWQRTITGYLPELNRVFFKTLPNKWPFGKTHSPQRLEKGHRGVFYLMNKLEALDAPNEWYYDQSSKTLYFYAPEGTHPNHQKVEVTIRKELVVIDKNNIQIKGLNFFGGAIVVNGDGNTISNCMIKHGAERLITDLNGARVSDAAIQVNGGIHNVVKNCVLEKGSVNGILLGNRSSETLVENCIVQHFNTTGIHAYLLGSFGERNRVIRNSFSGSARDGIYISGNDSEFAYNHVQKCLISGADGGLFYVTGNRIPKNIEVHHNWFHNAHADDRHAGNKATGIYLDNNSAGYIVHHNVVWDVEWAGLHFNWDAVYNKIYNNTFWNVGKSDEALISSWVPKRNGRQTNVKDNVLYNNISDVRPWWDSGDGKKYRVDEKEFLGDEADNKFENNKQFSELPFETKKERLFMPFAHSPLIDKGKKVKKNTKGYKGKAPDLGAYEYGGNYWRAGVNWSPKDFAWPVSKDYLELGIEHIKNNRYHLK